MNVHINLAYLLIGALAGVAVAAGFHAGRRAQINERNRSDAYWKLIRALIAFAFAMAVVALNRIAKTG